MTTGTSINDPRRALSGLQELSGARPTPFDPGSELRTDVERRAVSRPSGEGRRSALTVRAVMTCNARSCRPDDTLAAAALTMHEMDCRFLPVLDRTGHPIGVLTDGDVCLLGSTDHRPLRDILVREEMSGPPATCRADDDVLAVLKTMRERRIRHLPVVDDEGLLEGVVSLTDVLLCAEEENSPNLRQEVAATLRAIVQKQRNQRVIQQNPFVED